MASFQWAVPTGKGARRVARSMTSFGGGRGGMQQETFDAFEASDAGAEAFTMRQDEEELEVTIPVDEATAKKDVSVKFAARRLRVAVAGKGVVIDSGLKGRVVPDGCSWSFGKTKGAKALILTLEKRDGDTWAKLLAKTPPAPADAAAFLRWNQDEAYWKQNEDDGSAWRAYSEATDGPLCAYGVGVLAMRAVYTTWRRVVDAVASPGLFDEAELALARRWCYMPKRHSMDTGRGLEKTLVAAAGGPFQHGDWETPYPLPDRCDDSCVILETRVRPVCRAAMMDYVLNWIVQTMCTVAGAAPDADSGPPKEFMDAWFDKGNELKGAGDDDMLYVEVPGWVMDLALTHHVSSGVPRPRQFSRDVDREESSPMHPAERVVLELLPAEDGEPTGLDTPAARGNLSGFDMRLEDWSSVPGALELAARNPQAEQMRNMFAGK
ncbi:hypothetical protein SO694_00075114 [Aureococcus anophagefferens]|uniref:CS domain-containing protein n=1 Tax=Aureococcus anophagefferens TaxID=44056 RepID=A0ABR1FHC3_AURAN